MNFSIFPLFFLIFCVSAEFQFELKKTNESKNSLIDELNKLEELNGSNAFQLERKSKNSRRLQGGEMDLEPPTTYSKIVTLFYGKMLLLIEKNQEHNIAVIAKYTNSDTQILLCEHAQKSTFAELGRFIRLLHMYFKSIKQDGYSMQPSDGEKTVNFQLKYKAKTVENTEVNLEWHGEAHYDSNLHYFVYSTLNLKGDCTGIPNEIPEHPVQPKETYMNRLQSNLTNILFNGQQQKPDMFQSFIKSFLLDRTRVQFCEKNGETLGTTEFEKYLSDRYTNVKSFSDHVFVTQPFSDYQTDAVFTVIVNWKNGMVLKETYRFRVEEAREKGGDQGWKDWWSTWVFVECPVNLSPQTDPEDLKRSFMALVCGSIPPMITFGPSVSSRATFISHFMQREDQGFHAQICEQDNKPIYKFSEFDKWLATWSGEYDGAKLFESKVESYENFAFICIVNLMKNYGDHDKEWKKREFKMKAYYEVDRWLVKETKIGCDHF